MGYKAIRFVKRPETVITPDVFEEVELERVSLQEGEVRVRQTHMSLDPAMRGWMNATKSYIEPVKLGDVMRSNGLGEVVESRDDAMEVGAQVFGSFGWAQEAVVRGKHLTVVPAGLEPEAVLCVAGIPGLTAAYGLFDIGKPCAGETILITGAAGSVGSLVGQMAKASGLRVIGVSGSDEKRRWMEETLGFDRTLNYKSETLWKDLQEVTPDGIDVFFEHTGGPIQHMIIQRMNAFGRVVVCGMISDYNSKVPAPGPSLVFAITKRLTIQGFALPDHAAQFGVLRQRVLKYLMQGQLVYRAHVLEGLESAMEGINLLFSGGNKGKLMVRL